MKTFEIKNLAVLGLMILGTNSYASSPDLSGTVRMDYYNPIDPNTSHREVQLSRARLDFKGAINPEFSYKIRLEKKGNNLKFSETKFTWNFIDTHKFNVGITTPFFCLDDLEKNTYIKHNIGVLTEDAGQKLGFNFDGVVSDFGYSVGLWKVSDASAITVVDPSLTPSFSTKETKINLGFGGRVNYTVFDNSKTQVGLGVGLNRAALPMPVGVILAVGSNNATNYFNVIDGANAVVVDGTAIHGPFKFTTSYHHLNYFTNKADNQTNQTSSLTNLTKSYAHGFFGEISYLVLGSGYQYKKDTAVCGGIIFEKASVASDRLKPAFEIGLRAGLEHSTNFAFYDDINAATDSTTTYTQGDDFGMLSMATDKVDRAATLKTVGYGIHANYYLNPNVALKAEYYHDNFTYRSFDSADTDVPSHAAGINMRLEYSF